MPRVFFYVQHLLGIGHVFRALRVASGLRDVRVIVAEAPLAGLAVRTVVAWRLGMAHVAPFCAQLPPVRLEELTRRACAAVARVGLATPVRVLALEGRVA